MQKTISKIITGGVLCTLLFAAISCNRGEVFFSYNSLPAKGWEINDTLFFCPVIKDSLAQYDIFIEVRNDNRYSYQNLWLYVTDSVAKEGMQTTPVEIMLADEFGKWNGRGFSFLFESDTVYLQNVRFARGGEQNIIIRHGMKDSTLIGIRDIGLRIVKRE